MLVVDRCYRRPRTGSSTNLETRRGRYAAQKFPANVDVAVALSLAGVGPDRTQYEIWAGARLVMILRAPQQEGRSLLCAP